MRNLLQIELNEVNFDYVLKYGQHGHLPTLNGLIERHGLTETYSEDRYELLEPWIQWVSAHTGLSFAEHSVFRLGDIGEAKGLQQIWEVLEESGITVGAVSPMNAANKCANPAFFIPDPWTNTNITGSQFDAKLYRAIAAAVNENADGGGLDIEGYLSLIVGLMRYSRPTNWRRYLEQTLQSAKDKWRRALVLDLLLADLFTRKLEAQQPQFATLFLNAAAHIQHHYLFNSGVYDGDIRNPNWYAAKETDPILEIYRVYDRIVADIAQRFPEARLLIATGLHQQPYHSELYYWRLRDHADFMRRIGVEASRVEPRMSRDFVLYFDSIQSANAAETLLSSTATQDGVKLFQIDNRGDSLFVELVYPSAVEADTRWLLPNGKSGLLLPEVALVALKNGEHNGIGYLIDTAASFSEPTEQRFIGDLYTMALNHFKVAEPPVEPQFA